MTHKLDYWIKNIKGLGMYNDIWTNGLGQCTLNQGFMDQKCLVHREDK